MPTRKPKTKKAKRAAMKTTMDEWKAGTLHSGSRKGPKVKSRAQAIAIGLNQSGQSNKQKAARKKRLANAAV